MSRKGKQKSKGAQLSWDGAFLYADVTERIERHFSKLFTFTKPETSWTLPKPGEIYKTSAWTIEELKYQKDELNAVKDLLSDKDIILWRQHTHEVNLAGKIVPHVRFRIQAELCTQAWCKFYEILCSFPLVLRDPSLTSLNSVHLCEAPGAFVAALNHYLVQNYPHLKLKWLATTLNPYYEGNRLCYTISDDRFILPTIQNWEFGEDNTGDLFSTCNRKRILERAQSLGPIHLITADGSVDCQDNPSEQENGVAKLHFCEVMTALQILAPMGCLVVKMFTCFEHTSICLLYLLNCVFRQVHIYKPGTSKRGNSESYVVCINYLEKPEFLSSLHEVDSFLDNIPDKAIFAYCQLPDTFIQQIISCCTYFKNLQIEAVQEHLRWYQHMDPTFKMQLEQVKTMVVKKYVQKFAVAPIPTELTITNMQKTTKRNVYTTPFREGSFNERQEMAKLPWSERLSIYETKLKQAAKKFKTHGNNTFNQCLLLSSEQMTELQITYGKPFQTCNNSHFCHPAILLCWNNICDVLKESGVDLSYIYKMEDMVTAAEDMVSRLQLPTNYSYEFMDRNVCKNLAKEMQKCWDQSCISEKCQGTIVKVHLGDIRYSSPVLYAGHCFPLDIHKCLETLCSLLESCGQHDSMLFLTDPMLTRVNLAFLVILNHFFEKVTLLSFTSHGQPFHLILCSNYVRLIPKSTLDRLSSIKSNNGQDHVLMEILPISTMFSEPFFTTVYQFNSRALLNHSMHLIYCLK